METLPNECIELICNFCEYHSILQMRKVCKLLKQIIDSWIYVWFSIERNKVDKSEAIISNVVFKELTDIAYVRYYFSTVDDLYTFPTFEMVVDYSKLLKQGKNISNRIRKFCY